MTDRDPTPRRSRRPETEKRVVLPVDPTRRTEIDKQRVPMSARPYRLLALVKQDAVVRVQKEPDDTVMVWPHLLAIEFLAAAVMSVFLLARWACSSTLRSKTWPTATSRPPWPRRRGTSSACRSCSPTSTRRSPACSSRRFVLVGAALIPYIDRGDILAVRPSQRKTAVMLFTMFCILGLIVTFVGIFFRGPGYTFVIPYVTSPGLHFAL